MTLARTVALFVTVAAAALVLFLDVPRGLGAHPWWAAQVVWMGAPVGLALSLVVTRRAPLALGAGVVLAALTAAALAIATDGKSRFAASYAEDVLAGRFWYYGWIATALLGTAAIYTIIHTLVARLSPNER